MAYNKISRNTCIETGDLISCYENYLNTTSQWAGYWWEAVVYIYQEFTQWQEIYTLDTIMGELIRTTKSNNDQNNSNVLYRKFKDGRPSVAMEFMPNCGENIKNEEAVYFFKFYNHSGLEFNKIGTSAKDVVGRLRDEIGTYSKQFDICRVEIHRIVSCNGRPAEGAESALRAELIRQYPSAFRKNDRFFGVDISPSVFDEIVAKYFG